MNKYAELLEKFTFYDLVSIAETVYGPYDIHHGRKIVIIKKDDGTSRTVSLPKYLMEKHLGFELDPNIHTIDHIDSNIDNNDLSNLRIVPRDQHSADDTRRVKLIKLTCAICGKEFERSPRLIRDKAKNGKASKFCSRSCSAKYNRQVQLGQRDKLPASDSPVSEYYKRKYVQAFSEYLQNKYIKLSFIIAKKDAAKLDPETISEIKDYAENFGFSKFDITLDTIQPSEKEDLKFWLRSKTSLERDPEDFELIDQIGKNGKINRPIIIDTDGDYTVEGRHRLAAALKYNLPVPVVILSNRKN